MQELSDGPETSTVQIFCNQYATMMADVMPKTAVVPGPLMCHMSKGCYCQLGNTATHHPSAMAHKYQ